MDAQKTQNFSSGMNGKSLDSALPNSTIDAGMLPNGIGSSDAPEMRACLQQI